jgi:DNA polymerase-3 subunit gamma/tau
MLSKPAFNGLLKTLEEPPAHVKFLFATTEVNKVPVTVLSRCQRFDLRRISAEQLAAHFTAVCEKEAVQFEPEAVALIARAAEGSARDGLSILDQAIAHGAEGVTAEQVRAMLGLSDRGAVRTLLGLLLGGDAAGTLAAVKEQYDLGTEPSALIRGLLEAVHGITRAKVGGPTDPAQSNEEREAYAEWASRLSYATIHRLWQLLLKGLSEVHNAALPLEAAEMALLRVVHASDMPDPGALMGRLASGEAMPGRASSPAPAAESQAPILRAPASFAGLVAALEAGNKPLLAHELRENYRLVEYAPPRLLLQQGGKVREAREVDELFRRLREALKDISGEKWQVELSGGEAQPSLREQEVAAEERARQAVLETPLVKAALEAFPGAELTGFTINEQRSA